MFAVMESNSINCKDIHAACAMTVAALFKLVSGFSGGRAII